MFLKKYGKGSYVYGVVVGATLGFIVVWRYSHLSQSPSSVIQNTYASYISENHFGRCLRAASDIAPGTIVEKISCKAPYATR